MIRPIAALLTLAGLLSATEANAQHLFRRGHARPTVTHGTPVHASTPSYASGSAGSSRAFSYGDYSRSSVPTRTNVGHGIEEFPFHGTPYAHPYDTYTWRAMAGSNASALARYYDPPVK